MYCTDFGKTVYKADVKEAIQTRIACMSVDQLCTTDRFKDCQGMNQNSGTVSYLP